MDIYTKPQAHIYAASKPLIVIRLPEAKQDYLLTLDEAQSLLEDLSLAISRLKGMQK